MTTTCEYTRISLLFHILWKIHTFTFEHICTFFPNVYLVQFQSPLLPVAYYNSNILMVKIIAHFLHSVKWLKTRSLGRTVCFADQVAQLIDIPDYFQYLKLRLSDDCPHCCKSGGARGTPTLTVFRPADFKSAMASNYIIAPKFKEHAQSTRDYAPVKGKNLVAHESIDLSSSDWKSDDLASSRMGHLVVDVGSAPIYLRDYKSRR